MPLSCIYRLPRTDVACRELLPLLTPLNIAMKTNEEGKRYSKDLLQDKYLTGKILTQRIESNNRMPGIRTKRLARWVTASHALLSGKKKSTGPIIVK
ncbi:TPA: hypothetical protein JG904_002648 [Enterobacter hormaechei subsp. xiangfangensis]|nr:hypothetical protein [Enterobacter hormaechei subsp. xiangfangensis]